MISEAGSGPTDPGPTTPIANQGGEAIPPAHAAPQARETRRLYAADWVAFGAWCRERRQTMLPASPVTVAAYLEALSATLSHGALARRAAAIARQHRQAGHPSPGADPAVRDVLHAARIAKRAAARPAVTSLLPAPPATPARPPPPGPAQLARMAARCPGDLAGLRDRALLLLAASGLGGERLLAIDFEHVRFAAAGVAVTLSGSDRGPQEAALVARAAAPASCPVRALEAWLHHSDTRFGPVFRKVDRWGNVEHRRLRPDALRRIWQRRSKAMRLPVRTAGEPA